MASTFNRTRLARYISHSLADGADLEDLVRRVAAYLIDAGKTSELNSLLRDITEENARQNGYLEVKTESAFELSQAVKSEIEELARHQYPKIRQISIRQEINPKLVGGVKVLFPHDQFDLSVRTKLNRLANAR